MANVESGKVQLWATRLSSNFGIRDSLIIRHLAFVIILYDPHASRSRADLESPNRLVQLPGGLASGWRESVESFRHSLLRREPALHGRNVFE